MGRRAFRGVPGFTTDIGRSRGFAGWGVKCDEHLALDCNAEGEQDKIPYPTERHAKARRKIIESAVFGCTLPHSIVRVYHTRRGRMTKEEQDETNREQAE